MLAFLFGLRHLVVPVDSWRQPEKVKHVYNYNVPLSNGIKIVSVLQRLHGEIGRAISDVQKRTVRQTNGQTKKLSVFGLPAARVKSEPH